MPELVLCKEHWFLEGQNKIYGSELKGFPAQKVHCPCRKSQKCDIMSHAGALKPTREGIFHPVRNLLYNCICAAWTSESIQRAAMPFNPAKSTRPYNPDRKTSRFASSTKPLSFLLLPLSLQSLLRSCLRVSSYLLRVTMTLTDFSNTGRFVIPPDTVGLFTRFSQNLHSACVALEGSDQHQ